MLKADHAADIRATLERRGRLIGDGEFDRVDGLMCEDWGSAKQERVGWGFARRIEGSAERVF